MSRERLFDMAASLPAYDQARGMEHYEDLLDEVSAMVNELYRRLTLSETTQAVTPDELTRLAYLISQLHKEMGEIFEATNHLGITDPDQLTEISYILDGTITSGPYEQLREWLVDLTAICVMLLENQRHPQLIFGARAYAYAMLQSFDDPGQVWQTRFGTVTIPTQSDQAPAGYYLG